MTDKLHGIFPIGKSNKADRKLDVIFVHGLGGDARTTWQCDDDKSLFWPEWLLEDFDDIGVWTIGYGATPTRWIEDEMAMEDRAANLLNHLSLVEGLGERPIIFITHSMGGLITKHIFDQANTNPKYERFLKQVKGVVFLAVPHNGSGWANFLDAIGKIGRLNKVIEQLEKDDSGLRRLNNSFSQIVNKLSLQCLSFFETKEVKIKKKFLGTKGIMVVSESSAIGNFQQEPPIGLDNDHLSICKLQLKSDLLYLNIKKLINDHLPKEETTNNDSQKDTTPLKLQISKLPHTNSRLFGREDELAMLDKTWNDKQPNVLVLKAFGGTGKTALMQTWLNNLAEDHFRGANAVYTWSFYSQGSAEDKQASADEFFDAALAWFGYKGNPLPSPHNKGLKLAELVNQQHTLLILDGLEPLQYPEGGAMEGALRDAGIKTLLQQLSMQNKGLVLISSRQFINELNGSPKSLVIQHKLPPLSVPSGIKLFKAANIIGKDQELEDAINEVNGHALSLNLLAKYLSTYEDSDIRQRHNLPALVDFPEETRDSRHAYKVMAAYEQKFKDTVELKILYMLGLFDRPVSVAAIHVLRKTNIEQISDVADAVVTDNKIFKAATERLRQQDLLNNQNPEYPENLDAHPLVREYFAKRLQQQYPAAWQQAHAALYKYYKNVPDKEQPDELSEMEPLFSAIAHGCAAGFHQQALDEVYWPRIRREGDNYLCNKLGAFGTDLSALSHFFEKSSQSPSPLTRQSGWQTPAAGLTDADKAAALNWAAFRLRALGRLQEAGQPMQTAFENAVKQENWGNAASGAISLSELQLIRGVILQRHSDPETLSALKAAEQSVEFADHHNEQSGDITHSILSRTALADALHQAGKLTNARENFAEAEKLQLKQNPEYPKLYSVQGFQYCDLLLTTGEWQEVQWRAAYGLYISIKYLGEGLSLNDIGLDKLSLGRASLQQAIDVGRPITTPGTKRCRKPKPSATSSANVPMDYLITLPTQDNPAAADDASLSALRKAEGWLNQAVDGLRKAGTEHISPWGLLTRANYYRWCLSLAPDEQNVERALHDLQEAHDIAERGGMHLFICDYHLEAARLILSSDSAQKPFGLSASEHIEKAKKIIADTGYKRRLPELEYLKKMIKNN